MVWKKKWLVVPASRTKVNVLSHYYRGLIPTHGDIGNIGIFLRNLRSYFVVKSLHFLKESKYFSLFSSTTKLENHEKIEKMYLWNWGVSICHPAMEQFTDLLFEYEKSVCKIYVPLESKWKHCSVTMVFALN